MAADVGHIEVAVVAVARMGSVFADLGKLAKEAEKVAKSVAKLGSVATPLAAAFSAGIGAAIAKAAEFSTTVNAAFKHSKDVANTLAVETAKVALPAFKALTDSLAEIVAWMQALTPEQKASIGHWVLMAAEAAAVVVVVGRISAVVGTLIEVFSALAPIVAGAVTAPVLLGVAAFAALALAAGALWVEVIKPNLAAIREGFGQAWAWISDAFITYAWEPLKSALGMLKDAFFALLEVITDAADGAAKLFGKDLGATKFIEKLHGMEGGDWLKKGKQLGALVVDGLKTAAKDAKIMAGDFISATGLNTAFAKIKARLGLDNKTGAADLSGVQDAELLKKLGFEWDSYNQLFSRVADGTIEFVKDAKQALELASEAAGEAAAAKRIADLGYGPGGSQSKFVSLAPLAEKAMLEIEQNLAQVAKEARQKLEESFVSKLGELGTLIESAQQGFKAGGAWGAVIAVMVELLSKSKGFAALVSMLENIIQSISDGLGRILEPLQPLMGSIGALVGNLFSAIGPIFDALGSVLEPLGSLIMPVANAFTMLAPIFKALSAPLKLLGAVVKALYPIFVVVGLVLGVVALAIGAILDVFLAIGDLFADLAIAISPDDPNLKAAKAMADDYKVNLGDVATGMASIATTGQQQADAQAKAAAASNNLADAMNQTAQVLNAPAQGFKVTLERWKAAQGDGIPTQAAPSSGGGSNSTGAGGYANPYAHIPDWKRRGGDFDPLAADGGTSIGTLHININGITDPDKVAAAVQKSLAKQNLAKTGTGLQLTKRFA